MPTSYAACPSTPTKTPLNPRDDLRAGQIHNFRDRLTTSKGQGITPLAFFSYATNLAYLCQVLW